MGDTPNGETATPATPSNEPSTSGTPAATPPATPPVKTEDGEVEKLRKEMALQKEQAELREKQLANEIKAIEEREAARKAKELEEQNEFKTLYEQEKAKREEAEKERQAATEKEALKEAADKVYADYPDAVRNLAAEVGVNLTGTSDADIDSFKQKLDKIKASVGEQKVTPNNPQPPTKPQKATIENDEGIIDGELTGSKFDELAKSMPGVASLMGQPTEE